MPINMPILEGVLRSFKESRGRSVTQGSRGEEQSNMWSHGFRLSQVMSLSPAPLSLLIKAAPILTEEMYGDIQPAAWELLLSMDEHMAGAAGKERPPGTLVLLPRIPVFKQERDAFIPVALTGQMDSSC